MRAPEFERIWLEGLNQAVKASFAAKAGVELLEWPADRKASRTDPTSEGWWVTVARMLNSSAGFYLFIDNSNPFEKRGLWYGASDSKRSGISAIEHAGLQRWPHTQYVRGFETPKDLKFDDPWYQRYAADEYYYGWLEREAPATHARRISTVLVERITDRLSALLVELRTALSDTDLNLDTLDIERSVRARREQARLRGWLFSGRDTSECFACRRELPVDLLVAAHIKARALCTETERRDYRNNLIPLCTLGCDALFEKGYLIVENGKVLAGPRVVTNTALKTMIARLAAIKGRESVPGRNAYFAAHRIHHLRLVDLVQPDPRANTR